MIDYTGFALPKGTRRALEKPREDRVSKTARAKIIKAAFKRDNFRCRCCAYGNNLHAHEIRYRSQGGDPLDLSNVITLCNLCHLEGEHGRTGKGKTLQIIGRDAQTVRFAGSWIDYIKRFRAKAGQR